MPSLYEVTYNSRTGPSRPSRRRTPCAPARVRKQVVHGPFGDDLPGKAGRSLYQVTQDRVVLEIQRGCIRGCRFCQAGMIYRPTRERDVGDAQNVRPQDAGEYRA